MKGIGRSHALQAGTLNSQMILCDECVGLQDILSLATARVQQILDMKERRAFDFSHLMT